MQKWPANNRPPFLWRHTLRWALIWLGVIVLASALGLLWPPALVLGIPAAVIFLLLIVNCLETHFRMNRHFRKAHMTLGPQYREALEDGNAWVQIVESDAVAELPEALEDEGPALFFDVGGSQILCLQGDWLEPEDNQPWPNTRFEIVHTAKHHLFLGVFCSGSALQPRLALDPATFDRNLLPSDDTLLFRGSLNTLMDNLRRLAVPIHSK